MKTLKNIGIVMLMAIIFIFIASLGIKSYAENLNPVYWNLRDYAGSARLYCTEEGDKMSSWTNMLYVKRGSVTITGNTAENTDTHQTYTHKYNGMLAWLTAQYTRTSTNSSDYHVKEYSITAQGVWSFLKTWVNTVGVNIGIRPTMIRQGPSGSLWASNRAKAEEYANSIGGMQGSGVSDNTNKSNIKVEAVEINGTQYCQVGPFNWTFGGNLSNFVVKDQDERNISNVSVGVYSGSSLKVGSSSQITSGKDFYVLIPTSSEVSAITNVSASCSSPVIKVWLAFYQSQSYAWQNMIYISQVDNGNVSTPIGGNVDVPLIGNIRVIKVNKYNHECPLDGVGFYIQNTSTGKWVKQNGDTITYVDSRDQATEFVTDENGEIEIDNLIVGEYEAFESKNPHYGYEMPTDGMPLTIVAGTTTDNTLENLQVYVKLSGYVWIDIPTGKVTDVDNHYTDGTDYRVDGIPVRLVDSSGNVVKNEEKGRVFETTTTEVTDDILNEDKTVGAFLFEDVPLKDDPNNPLGDYHLEFDYNGLVYVNVQPLVGDVAKSSKAAESSEARTSLNTKLNGVKSNGPGSENGTAGEIEFTYEHGESNTENAYKEFVITPDYIVDGQSGQSPSAHYQARTNTIAGQKQAIVYDYEGNGNRMEGIREATKITASTDAAGYSLNDAFTWGDEIVRHNNLGLYKREQPDMSLIKDISSVAVTYNGYNHIYQYNKRFEHQSAEAPGYDVGVKYGSEYGAMEYSQPIYEADYAEAITEDNPDAMCAYITYAIGLRNQSTDLTVKVNTVIDYFDNDYSDFEYKIGDGEGSLNDKGIIETSVEWDTSVESVDGNYQKLTISCDKTIEPEQEAIIYVQFKLNAKDIEKIITLKPYTPSEDEISGIDDDRWQSDLMYNVAEIGSYSTFQNGVDYAGIDVDSNPGNALIAIDENGKPITDNDHYYEDDTDVAPAFRLVQQVPRIADGLTFVDQIVTGPEDSRGGLMTGYERLGNGIYEKDVDKTLEGVEVALIEVDEDGKIVKDENGEDKIAQLLDPSSTRDNYTWNSATATTKADGTYQFTGYVPGRYIVRFTWGDEQHKVQYYKATIYGTDGGARYNNNLSNLYWYKQESLQYSDALDDLDIRQQIDDQLKHLTFEQQTIIDGYNPDSPGDVMININGVDEPIIKKMISKTLIMDMGIEHQDEQLNGNVTTYETDPNTKAGVYLAKDIDFGIAERPKQALEMDKQVDAMKISLANGQVIVDITRQPDGTFAGENSNLIYLEPSNGTLPYQGLLRLELDNELIQGALVEVTYKITATNISEIDYLEDDYYNFGVKGANTVTITPSTVIDYLDQDWEYNSTINPETDGLKWTIISNIGDVNNFFTDINGTVNGLDGSQTPINNYTVLYVEFTKALNPGKDGEKGDSVSHTINVNKTLTTTDEIELDNQAEVVEVNKTGGSGLDEETPGNLNPDEDFAPKPEGEKEPDNDKAETVIVTPNTGANLNFILPISVAAVALIILGTGVVLIRKKVLRS